MMNPSQTQPIIDALERAPAIVIPLVREAPAHLLKRRPAPTEWSIHEVACHLADVHNLFFTRLDLLLREDTPFIKPYLPDQDEPDPDRLLKMDLDAAMEAYARDRATLVEKLKALTSAQWSRTARHPEYACYSVFIMFRHLALHDLMHSYDIEAMMLRPDWP
jgi:uncharacterized damage-inducible protein DinB